jgi:hypothetical protein
LDELEIPVIGFNRPTSIIIIKIDDGKNQPYILNTSSNNLIDQDLKELLIKTSNQRGMFFELPIFDLNDLEKLNNLTIFDSEKEIILKNYEYDFEINLQISQPFINQWIITGDINQQKFISYESIFLDLEKNLNKIADEYLSDLLLVDVENSILVKVANVNTYNDLIALQRAMKRLISIKDKEIRSYFDSSLSYAFTINGSMESFMKEIDANLDLQFIEMKNDTILIELNN